jgi:triacylglycerol lipase
MLTPIVLQHGLFGFDEIRIGKLRYGYFNGIDRAIEARGHPLVISKVHPTSSIEMRAKQLKETIDQRLSGYVGKVVILAHSMGGLDARYMISKLGMDDRVSALVTISTPHRGSPYADWCLKNLGQKLGGLKIAEFLGLNIQAMNDLTTDSCARFNEKIADVRGVRYFSISAARHWHLIPPWLLHAHKVVYDAEGDNDGVVSVKSATWGEHLETWAADHLHAINRRLMIEIKNPTGDITPKYLAVLDRLSGEGLC